MKLKEFMTSYMETALWSSSDSDQGILDGSFTIHNFSEESTKVIKADCEAFISEFSDLKIYQDDRQLAHDFWLTRNGHGAGFWDGDYVEPYATVLTQYSEKQGECDIYVADNGLIYIS